MCWYGGPCGYDQSRNSLATGVWAPRWASLRPPQSGNGEESEKMELGYQISLHLHMSLGKNGWMGNDVQTIDLHGPTGRCPVPSRGPVSPAVFNILTFSH